MVLDDGIHRMSNRHIDAKALSGPVQPCDPVHRIESDVPDTNGPAVNWIGNARREVWCIFCRSPAGPWLLSSMMSQLPRRAPA